MKQETGLLEYIKKKYSPTSTNSHYNNALRYLVYIGEKALPATYQDVLGYIEALRTQELHPKTLRNYLFGVKIYYSYLQENGQRQDHPCKRLYLKDQINRAIPMETLYSEKQLEELMTEYRSIDKRVQQRNLVIISLLIYQALNIKEITNLQMCDVDLEKGEIFIKKSVSLKERTLPLKPNQIMLFYNYIHHYRKSTLEYFNQETESFIITKYAHPATAYCIRHTLNKKMAPEGKFTTIKIRQSVITNLLKNNDVRIVQVFAGHRRSSATEAYTQSGIEELKDDIRKVHPLR
jgi:integrase/recombinase XerD